MDLTPADMLALLRRTTDVDGWLQPLLDDPDSAAAINAQIQIFGRLGRAVTHLRDALTISAASGGQIGTGVLTVGRGTTGTHGTITKGYLFIDARGVRVRSQADVAVANGDAAVFVPVQTERETELVNSEDDSGFTIAPDSTAIKDSGGVVNLIAPAGDPANAATTFSTVAATPITGGAVDMLSVHGRERGLLRQSSETESAFRQRIRNIVDMVTPFAVADVVQAEVQQFGLPQFLIKEPFNDGASVLIKNPRSLSFFSSPAFDADSALGHADFLDDFIAGLVLVDRRTAIAYFEMDAQDYIRDPQQGTMFWDASFYDDPMYGYPDGLLDFPSVVLSALLALIQDVTAKKPIGVNFDVFLRDPDVTTGVGASTANVLTVAWTITPPAGSKWMVVEAFAGHDSPIVVPTSTHKVVYTLDDATTLDTGEYGDTDTQRLLTLPSGHLVTQIQGFVKSDGVTAVNLVGTFRTIQIVN